MALIVRSSTLHILTGSTFQYLGRLWNLDEFKPLKQGYWESHQNLGDRLDVVTHKEGNFITVGLTDLNAQPITRVIQKNLLRRKSDVSFKN